MIPQRYIEEWKSIAPWPMDAQVEQDIIIARTLVEIFSDDLLKESLAFRGGTALHKLYLTPQIRYSFFDFPVEIRKIIYTTNLIENLNGKIRKYTKNKLSFPNDDALKKAVYLAVSEIEKKWTQPIWNWGLIFNQFLTIFENRIQI